jgi:Lon protease-like protein
MTPRIGLAVRFDIPVHVLHREMPGVESAGALTKFLSAKHPALCSTSTMLTSEQLADLPVFPLPNMVMFPGSVLPLHIFEPRYRAMVAWCLENDSPMGVAMIHPGSEGAQLAEPKLISVCGVGQIQRHLELPDGRYNLVLRSELRVHLEEELPLRDGFRRFRVSEQPDLPADPQSLARHLATIKALGDGLATTVPSLGYLLNELMGKGMPAAQIADQIIDFTTLAPSDKQQVLEERDALKRLAAVEELLADLLATSVHDHSHDGHQH